LHLTPPFSFLSLPPVPHSLASPTITLVESRLPVSSAQIARSHRRVLHAQGLECELALALVAKHYEGRNENLHFCFFIKSTPQALPHSFMFTLLTLLV